VTSADQLVGRGVAASGRIVVTAHSGHLVRAELDRGVAHMRPDALTQELTQAINCALDDVRPVIPVPDLPHAVDLREVARDFTAIRYQAGQLLQAIVSAMQDAVADLASDGKLPSGVSLPDAGKLLEPMDRVDSLLSLTGAGILDDTNASQARGVGQAGGLVRAVAVPPGQVGHLEVEPGIARVGSEELGSLVVAAVNMALDSLEQIMREQSKARQEHAIELKNQFQKMSETALAQMQEFGSVASGMMWHIGTGSGAGTELPGPPPEHQ
jgi:DNA-binding protein YbaB